MVIRRQDLGSLPGYPFESNFATVGGQTMHYVDEGPRDAPVVVMVHGNPTWSYFFRHLIAGLSASYRCVAVDHIGMGLSTRPAPGSYDFTLAQRADDLEALLDTAGVTGRMNFILHDWGGMIGMTVASRFPERIDRLVALNTAAFTLPEGAAVPWQIRAFRGPLGKALVANANAFCRGAATWCARTGLPPEVRNAYLAPYATWPAREAVLRFVEDIPVGPSDRAFAITESVEAAFSAFAATPTLLPWGMRDFVFNEHFLLRWKALLPHAIVHRFPNGGHYLLEDHPDEVLNLVTDFLKTPLPSALQEAG